MWKNGQTYHHGGYIVHFANNFIILSLHEHLDEGSGTVIDKDANMLTVQRGSVHACGDGYALLFTVGSYGSCRLQAFEWGIAHIQSITTLPHKGSDMIWEAAARANSEGEQAA